MGWCIGSPGQRLAAGVLAHQDRGWWAVVGLVPGLGWNRGMELAARLIGLMLVGSLVMSEACFWACQGAGICPRWSAVVGIGHHSQVADRHSSPPTTSRPGANVLQDLPIILFCSASKSFLLLSSFLQLFPLIFSITVHVSWT